MERDNAYFITLLSAFIHGRPVQAQSVDWESVCHMGQIHSVSGIIYFKAQEQPERCRPLPSYMQRLRQDFYSTLARSTTQDDVVSGTVDAFCRAGIAHLIFKGYAIKN